VGAGSRARIFFGGSILRAVQRSRSGLVGSVVWRKVPAGPVQVTACWRWNSARILFQVWPAVLGDADEEQGEPAEDDVGADAVLAPVVDGAQVDDLLHVAPAALKEQAGLHT
jgi:hypothetical protein